jgi:hypothetical protein
MFGGAARPWLAGVRTGGVIYEQVFERQWTRRVEENETIHG